MFRGLHFSSLILILVIALLLFGTKRLRTIGEDLGAALKNFRKSMHEESEKKPEKENSSTEEK